MTCVFLEDFKCSVTCNTIEQLTSAMQKRNDKGYNEFWICMDEKQSYPCIVVSVKDDLAYLHYFEEEGEPGWASVSERLNGLDEEGMTTFYTNNGAEEIMIENRAIVAFDKAVEAVEEFSDTGRMPNCMEWEEL